MNRRTNKPSLPPKMRRHDRLTIDLPLDRCQPERCQPDRCQQRNQRCIIATRRFLLNPSRTSKQGQQINVGKDNDEYRKIVNTLSMHEQDMQSLGISAGDSVRVKTEFGEATFQCETAKVPLGMLFVPYGPPTCRLMGGSTDGTGMPTSKGWEVEVEPVEPQA